MDQIGIGERVRELRSERGLSQAKLGELVGVHENTIRNLETAATNTTVATLADVARVLGVEISELLAKRPSKKGRRKPAA